MRIEEINQLIKTGHYHPTENTKEYKKGKKKH